MNINAKEGDKVIITEKSALNGYEGEQAAIMEVLKLNTPYTVDYIDVGNFNSYVNLKGFPNNSFNTVLFEDYTEHPKPKLTLGYIRMELKSHYYQIAGSMQHIKHHTANIDSRMEQIGELIKKIEESE